MKPPAGASQRFSPAEGGLMTNGGGIPVPIPSAPVLHTQGSFSTLIGQHHDSLRLDGGNGSSSEYAAGSSSGGVSGKGKRRMTMTGGFANQ